MGPNVWLGPHVGLSDWVLASRAPPPPRRRTARGLGVQCIHQPARSETLNSSRCNACCTRHYSDAGLGRELREGWGPTRESLAALCCERVVAVSQNTALVAPLPPGWALATEARSQFTPSSALRCV